MQWKHLHRVGRGESHDDLPEVRSLRDEPPECQWDFFQDPDSHWRWQRFDSAGNLVALSPASYRYAIDCVGSAQADGFVVDDAIAFARMLNSHARLPT